MSCRVLLIDDDPNLLEALAIAFEGAGYATTCAADGDAGLAAIRRRPPDAIISDVNMPGTDGFSLCRRLRAEGCWIPIVLLTARDGEIDEALGLDLGADDYVSKPFSTNVLMARVSSLLRREQARVEQRSVPQQVGALQIDRERLEVRYRGVRIDTTVTELRLLDVLSANAGRVLSRSQLLAGARDDGAIVAERIVDTYVARLRRKLCAVEPGFDRIETVIGAGYRYKDV